MNVSPIQHRVIVGYLCIACLIAAGAPMPHAIASEGISFEDALRTSLDTDGDGLKNLIDNCPFDINPSQVDSDDDGVGDACEDFELVQINVTPGDLSNDISLSSSHIVPIAIVSSSTFDATAVSRHSIKVSGHPINVTGKPTYSSCVAADVTDDNLDDLLCDVFMSLHVIKVIGPTTLRIEATTTPNHRIRGEVIVSVIP